MEKNLTKVLDNKLPEESGLSLAQIKFSKVLAIIIALFAINNVIYFTPGFFGEMYYALIAVFVIVSLFGGGRLRINIEMWLLYAVCWLSILGNNIPAVFRAEFRCISFMLVTLLLAPAFSSESLMLLRQNLFRYLLNGCIIVSLLSFVGKFIGFSIYLSTTVLWCGITAHSMLLGPISGVATITLLYRLLTEKETKKIFTYSYLFALASSVFCLLGAASRTSILATLAGVFVLIIKKGSLKKVIPLLLIGFIVCAASFSFISSLWENVVYKNNNETTLNFDSRNYLWKQRLNEFKENPFLGIGFANIENTEGESQNTAGGKIEPGSSWLITLSMIGILGGLAFLLVLNNTLARLTQNKQKEISCLLFALGVFWGVEMCAEGFVFASGSFLFFMLWSWVGAVESLNYIKEDQVIEDKSLKHNSLNS